MKAIQSMIVALLIMAMGATHAMAQDQKVIKKDERITFAVEIICSNCVTNIKKQFAYEKGVKDVRVNQAKQQVIVTYNPTKTDTKRMIAAFKEIGKDATVASPPETLN